MQSFKTFINSECIPCWLFQEAARKNKKSGKGGGIKKRKEYERPYKPAEMDYVWSQMKPGAKMTSSDVPTGFPKHIKDVLLKQEPVYKAWLKAGLNANPAQVADMVKKQGHDILPGKSYIRSYAIERLKQLKDKVKNNEDLSPREQEIVQIWGALSKQLPPNAMGVNPDDPSHMKINVADVVDYLDDQNKLDTVINKDEAEMELVKSIKDEIEQGREGLAKISDYGVRNYNRRTDLWRGVLGKQVQHGVPDEKLSGVRQVAGVDKDLEDALADAPEDDPEDWMSPSITVGYQDYVAVEPDPKVLEAYEKDPKLMYEQIYKPICQTVTRYIQSKSRIMRQDPREQMDYTSPSCGLEKVPYGKEGGSLYDAIDNWLQDGDTSLSEILQKSIDTMLRNTAAVNDETGESWMESESLRYKVAHFIVRRHMYTAYEKMMKRINMEKDLRTQAAGAKRGRSQQGAPEDRIMGDKETEKDREEKSRFEKAARDITAIDDAEVEDIIMKIRGLMQDAMPEDDDDEYTQQEKESKRNQALAEVERLKSLAAKHPGIASTLQRMGMNV